MTVYLLTAAMVTLALVLIMTVTHREIEVTPAGLLWLMIWGLIIPLGLYFIVVLLISPSDEDDENLR